MTVLAASSSLLLATVAPLALAVAADLAHIRVAQGYVISKTSVVLSRVNLSQLQWENQPGCKWHRYGRLVHVAQTPPLEEHDRRLLGLHNANESEKVRQRGQ